MNRGIDGACRIQADRAMFEAPLRQAQKTARVALRNLGGGVRQCGCDFGGDRLRFCGYEVGGISGKRVRDRDQRQRTHSEHLRFGPSERSELVAAH